MSSYRTDQIFACDLTEQHVGQDLTLTIGSTRTGGIVRSVTHLIESVKVDLDGTVFVVDADKPVEVNDPAYVPYTDLPVPVAHPIRGAMKDAAVTSITPDYRAVS